MDSPDRPGLTVIDEMRHRTDGQPGWREEWAFWFWSADGSVGGYTGLTVVGNGNETWYRSCAPLLRCWPACRR